MSAGIRVQEAPGAQGWGVRAVPCGELGFFQDPRHLKFSEFLLIFFHRNKYENLYITGLF